MINLDKLAPLTPENVHKIKWLASLGRGEIKATAWIDENTLAVASKVALWHYTRDGQEREVTRFNYPMLKFSENGKLLMAWNLVGGVFIHDSASGDLRYRLRVGLIPTPYLHWTSNNGYLAIGGRQDVQIFEMVTGQRLTTLNIEDILSSRFVENVLWLKSKTGVYQYDVETGMLSDPLTIEWQPVGKEVVSVDGSAAATINDDHEVVIRANGETYCFPYGHRSRTYLMTFDQQQLVCADTDQRSLCRWSLETGNIIHRFRFPQSSCLLDGDRIVRTEGRLGVLNRLSIQDVKTGETLLMRENSLPLSFTADHLIYVSDYDSLSVVFFMSSKEHGVLCISPEDHLITKLNLKTGIEETFVSLASQNRFYIGVAHYAIHTPGQGTALFDVETHRLRGIFHPKYETRILEFSSQHVLIISNRDWWVAIDVWDIESGQHLIEADYRLGVSDRLEGISVMFSPDSRFIAFSYVESGIKVWKDNQFHGEISLDMGWHIAFSPDSRLLFGMSLERKGICVWETETLELLATLEGVTGIGEVAVRPDLIAISHNNGTIGLWGVEA